MGVFRAKEEYLKKWPQFGCGVVRECESMAATGSVNMIWWNIIRLRKGHRAGHRPASSASAFEQAQTAVAARRLQCGKAKQCQLGALGDTQQRFQRCIQANARERQPNKNVQPLRTSAERAEALPAAALKPSDCGRLAAATAQPAGFR